VDPALSIVAEREGTIVASDNLRALARYERAGMGVKFRFDNYERPTSPS
jgi:hypothetical protein